MYHTAWRLIGQKERLSSKETGQTPQTGQVWQMLIVLRSVALAIRWIWVRRLSSQRRYFPQEPASSHGSPPTAFLQSEQGSPETGRELEREKSKSWVRSVIHSVFRFP